MQGGIAVAEVVAVFQSTGAFSLYHLQKFLYFSDTAHSSKKSKRREGEGESASSATLPLSLSLSLSLILILILIYCDGLRVWFGKGFVAACVAVEFVL